MESSQERISPIRRDASSAGKEPVPSNRHPARFEVSAVQEPAPPIPNEAPPPPADHRNG
jgi:hypothetical protein